MKITFEGIGEIDLDMISIFPEDTWKGRKNGLRKDLVQEQVISKYKMKNHVNEKGYRNKPLTDEQQANNREKSKIRARVEHVFGFMEQSMNGLILKSVGITRASGIIGLINLTYNLFRYEQVIRISIL